MRNKLIYISKGILLLCFLSFSSCEIEQVTDPNNPSVQSATSDASLVEIQFLVTGLEGGNRGYYGNASQMFGTFGREVWPYFASDPRFLGDWLSGSTYNTFFGSGGTYTTPYRSVKQANVIIEAAANSSQLTAQQAAGASGFAKTIKGFQLTWPLLQQWNNGIRIDVEDPLNPGPRVGIDNPQAAFAEILNILNDGLSDLNAAGSSFSFTFTSAFADFDTPARMAELNRAIAARVALYAEDYTAARSALSASFMDMDVDETTSDKMFIGPVHVYGNPPDATNPLFAPFDQPTARILICHPSWIEDAEAGDLRLNKVRQLVDNLQTNGGLRDANGDLLVGEYQDVRYAEQGEDIPFIRNEELILISAELSARAGNTQDAVDAINVVRNTWGLGDYAGGTSEEELIDEVLHQRRYSLWCEGGHRWVDLRRTNRLNENYVDLRDQGGLITSVARPISEVSWDNR
jgi:hypothetical protein